MKKIERRKWFLSVLCAILTGMLPLQSLAGVITIPTSNGTFIDWNEATLTGAQVENGGANIGSTGASTVAVFNIQNPQQQDYILTFATGSKSAAKMKVTLEGSSKVLDKEVEITNTGNWTPSVVQNFLLEQLPVGQYTLTFQVTEASGYAGNWGKLAFRTTDNIDKAPGTLTLANGSYSGSIRTEDNDGNVGWVNQGDVATHPFKCTEAGVYALTMDVARYGDCRIEFFVTDDNTGEQEAATTYYVTTANPRDYTATTFHLGGELTTGMKKLKIAFYDGGGFLINYKNMKLDRVGDHYASIKSVAVSGQTVTAGDDTDWFCQLPADYAATTTFSVNKANCTIVATAANGGNAVTVTDNGDGTYTLPTPGPSENTTVTLTLTPDEGAASGKSVYTLKIFRIGEISLADVQIDGLSVNVLETINAAPYTATYDNVYTAIPTVTAKIIDGTLITAAAPSISGTAATYTLHATMAGQTRDYTLTVNGLHIYEKAASDETVELKYSQAGNDKTNNVWSDGLYTLSPIGDGWDNSGFKMKSNSTNTLTLPTDVRVKQFIIHQFSDNYSSGELESVSSEGMTAYIPAKHDFATGKQYDLIINLDGHQAGQPIVFTLKNGSQPTGWFELTIEKVAIATAPVLKGQSVTPTTSKNHCVVALTFDREMKATEATINNTTVRAEGGSSTLYFPVWNLSYDQSYTFTVAAGAATDNYGNANAEPINVGITVGPKPVVEQKPYDYVVSTADEFKAAIAAVNSSNGSATAARKTIFVKNGDYDFGSVEQNLKAYNVSIIGESRDGVLLHGNRTGITNPVMQINSTGGDYFQDFTIRNDLDWNKARAGVGVAFSGGKKAVLKNIVMQSQQDTQVTGESAYHTGCRIYGAVDFICGGGDIFYDQCDLLITNGGHITAPSTSPLLKWGYVFQNCTIDTAESAGMGDGSYNLGRPWQNEPRAYFLNTTMNIKSSNDGWAGMGTLPTHFYEYNSMDKNGQQIDLSIRKNSPTSTNSYTPVLTADEAKLFTVENVLGGTDSWLATEETVETAAPAVTLSGATLSWPAVEDARCYVIFKDGQYLANQTATTYEATENGTYTVRSANLNGGLCGTSEAVIVSDATGISAISASQLPTDGAVYNLQGQRVNQLRRGQIYIINNRKVVR